MLHFLLTGHYLLINPFNKAPQAAARLISTQFSNTAARCLSFWYHMHGADINRLNVYLANVSTNSLTLGPAIWTRHGEQGLLWLNAAVDLGAVNNYVKVTNHCSFIIIILLGTFYSSIVVN